MTAGIGVDVVEIDRLKKVSRQWRRSFLKKIFTEGELRYSFARRFPYQHLAARFAAKEAVFKALGSITDNFVGWRNVEVVNDSSGRPKVTLSGRAETLQRKKGIKEVLISLSHTQHYAVASAFLVLKNKR